MQENKRINKVILIVGGRGSGKTHYLKDLIRPIPKKRIVCDTFDSPVWQTFETFKNPAGSATAIPVSELETAFKSTSKQAVRIVNSDTDLVFETIEKKAWNCMIIIEDATRFIQGRVPDNVKRLVLDTKQRNVDIVFVFHSLNNLPPDLIRWSDYITLFKTVENFTPSLRNKIPNPEIEIAFNKVQKMEKYSHLTIAIGG